MEGDMFEERIKLLFRVRQAAKIVKHDNVPCKIEEGLYIGSLGAANNKSALQSLNVTHILIVANSLAPAHPNDFTYHTIQDYHLIMREGGSTQDLHRTYMASTKTYMYSVTDRVDAPISQYFDECFAFIEEARRIGGGVLVHCFAGKSRSVTTVVAYLMFKNGVGLSEAFERVKSVRPVASPNPGFMSQLQEFERSLQGTKT